jgi:hypothetical protein
LIPRIHTYTALASFVALMVYAVAGLAPTSRQEPVIWELPFHIGAAESDRAVAQRVMDLLDLRLARPLHDFNISHDLAGRLTLDFYHANGRHRVTVIDQGRRLRVIDTRAPFARYLSTLHVTTAAFHSGDWRLQLWAWYNEMAMWALAAMLLTGGWMALKRRGKPGILRRAHWIVAWSALPVLTIFSVTAIQMAHRTWFPALSALDLLHRERGGWMAPVASGQLLLLGATGLWLWFRAGGSRRAGTAALTFGVVVAGGLIAAMRWG